MKFRLVIHGGAGAIKKEKMTPEKEAAYRAALETALRAGYGVLTKGGAALDAVIASIKVMEDSPLFNAAKGAVFNHEGKNELDASLMDGRTLAAGAVAEITTLKNPIVGALVGMVSALYYERRKATAERASDSDLRDAAEAHRRIYQAIRARDAARGIREVQRAAVAIGINRV